MGNQMEYINAVIKNRDSFYEVSLAWRYSKISAQDKNTYTQYTTNRNIKRKKAQSTNNKNQTNPKIDRK